LSNNQTKQKRRERDLLRIFWQPASSHGKCLCPVAHMRQLITVI
jgi:hypothetical protein